MTVIDPEAFIKRSSVYRQLPDADFTELAGGAVASKLVGDCREQAQVSGLMDLSIVPRSGFRGSNASAHLQALGLPVPEGPNQLSTGEKGELVLRLSPTEYWVLAPLDNCRAVERLKELPLPPACYPLYCQDSHAWFVMTGNHIAETMAKVCGVDLRETMFPKGAIAQTSVARVNAVIARHDVGGLPAISILSDSASSEYLWQALLDAMTEFGGRPVSLAAVQLKELPLT